MINDGEMSLSKSNTSDHGTVPIDLSKAAQSTFESHVTAATLSIGQNNAVSHATAVSYQGQPTYGIRVANSAVTVPGSISQGLTSQIPINACHNLQVARSSLPLVSAGIGTSQMVYPRITHPAFPQPIPISSAIIGQQITLQRLPSKGQHLPLGSVTQISGQQIIHSSGKAISPRPAASTGNLQRPVISSFSTAPHFQKSNTPTLVSVSQAQQIGLRVPNATGHQMTIQRAISPLVAQQMSGTNQPNFIQCLSNAAVVSQQIAHSLTNAGSLQTTQSVGSNLRTTSPIVTATIVGPTSHIGTTAFVAGQPISIQPRPSVAFIASAPPTGMTLTVSSISPGPSALQTAVSTTSTQITSPTQQVLWPGSPISQGQVIRTGIPVVLPRGTLTFAGRPQLIQSSTMPRLFHKPLASLTATCGGQVTVQVPQVINPVIKTVQLQNQAAILPSKDVEMVQATSSSQSPAGVIFTAVLVPTTSVTSSSSQAPLVTLTTTASASQVVEVDNSHVSQSPSRRENKITTSEPVTDLSASKSVTTVTTTSDISAGVSSSVLLASAPVSSLAQSSSEETREFKKRETLSKIIDTDVENITTSTAEGSARKHNQSSCKILDVHNVTEVKDKTSPDISTFNSQASKISTDPSCLTETASKITEPENGCDFRGSLSSCSTSISDTTAKHASNIQTLLTPTPSTTTVTQSTTHTASSGSISVLSLTGSHLATAGGNQGQQDKLSVKVEPRSPDNDDTRDGGGPAEGVIDSNLLEWSDGVGKLPGTDMKFKINEFGDLELMEDGGLNGEVRSNSKIGVEGRQYSHGMDSVANESGTGKKTQDCSVSDPTELSDHEGDPICCCVYCGRYGYKSNFKTSGRFCSQNCAGKRKLHRKQVIMSRMMMGMKKKKKKLIMSGEMKTQPQEQQNGSGMMSAKKLLNFDWDSYLAETKSVGAPKRLFKEPFPTARNGFRLGMRLEGIDPKHQSLFCVLSVAEVQGYRLRLHFDGYSECYDFWVNADSALIFPVGFAEKNGKILQPPKNIPIGEFNWTNYLKQTRAVTAPKHLFLNQPSSVVPSAFRVGMKLEAVDKKNSILVCVASVSDTLGDRILVHFDGWEDTYDYWCDVTSPSIRPVGWCHSNGHTLSPPPDYEDGGNFTWHNYLQETQSTAVPSRAFKTRGPMGFEKDMKVEVMDKRNPILIRVASVADVQDYRLLIHFDGWDSIYDYWIDDDSSELHPPNWCSKTFHPLQSPIDKKSLKYVSDSGGCPTVGCNGIGHIKGAKYTGHHSAFGCPYSEVNMSKDSALTDRLGSSRSEEGSGQSARYDGTADMRKCPTQGCDGLGHVTGKFTSHHCLSGCPLAEKNLAKIKQETVPETRPVGRPGRGRKRKLFSFSQTVADKVIKTEALEEISEDRSTFHASIHESVFQSMTPSLAMLDQPLCWEQHAKLLPGVTEVNQTVVSTWTVDEVADFVFKLTGNEEQAQKFREEQVDGDSFLLLQQSDLMNFLNIKLGPAIKIFNSILVFKAATESY